MESKAAIRPMQQYSDRFDVQRIEDSCFEHPWTEKDFDKYLRAKNIWGYVFEDEYGTVVGYIVYELHPFKLDVLNLAVHPEYRHRGFGRALLGHVLERLSKEGVPRLTCMVRESNLDAQCFLRACGIRAVNVAKKHWANPDEDGYLFAKRQEPDVKIEIDPKAG